MAGTKVTLTFAAGLAKRARAQTLPLEVDDDFRSGLASIRKVIDERLGANTLYTVVYNGSSISLVNVEAGRIRDGDEFKVVPIVLGG
jgi:hypothetical protein